MLRLYVDDAYDGATPFGKVRRRAFKIMPREKLQLVGQRMSTKSSSQLTLRWEAVDKVATRVQRHLRPLYEALEPTPREPFPRRSDVDEGRVFETATVVATTGRGVHREDRAHEPAPLSTRACSEIQREENGCF